MKLTKILDNLLVKPELLFRRALWGDGSYISKNNAGYYVRYFPDNTIFGPTDMMFCLAELDIVATDWEIVEEDKTPGQIAYEADITKYSPWNELSNRIRENWESIAQAVLKSEKEKKTTR